EPDCWPVTTSTATHSDVRRNSARSRDRNYPDRTTSPTSSRSHAAAHPALPPPGPLSPYPGPTPAQVSLWEPAGTLLRSSPRGHRSRASRLYSDGGKGGYGEPDSR